MKLFNKRENERRRPARWGKSVPGNIWFDACILNDTMRISQTLVKYNDMDTGEEVASITIPMDVVK